MTKDELILITGASGGVGSCITEGLIREGWRNVVCQYRHNRADIAEILDRNDLDPERHLFGADLTSEGDVQNMRAEINRRFGSVRGLINLAGGSSNGMSWKMSLQEFRQIIDMNLTATFLACREFIPQMREQGGGRIINTSSVVAFTGAAGASHYCAAKAGIVGFTKSLALELAPKNIAVSAVALGYFKYGLIHSIPAEQQDVIRRRIPASEFGDASHLTGLLSFLLSDAGAYSGGQVYHLNGGMYS